MLAVHRVQDVAVTAVPTSGHGSANAQRGGGRASSAFRMAVIGDAAKTSPSPPVDESRGCGAAMVLDNAQWLDHNRCGVPHLCFAGKSVLMTFGSEPLCSRGLAGGTRCRKTSYSHYFPYIGDDSISFIHT